MRDNAKSLIVFVLCFLSGYLYSQNELSQLTRLDTIIGFDELGQTDYNASARARLEHFTRDDTTVLLFKKALNKTYYGYFINHVSGEVKPMYLNFEEFYTRNIWRGGSDNVMDIYMSNKYLYIQSQNKIYTFEKKLHQDTIYALNRYNDKRGIGGSLSDLLVLENSNKVILYSLSRTTSGTKLAVYSLNDNGKKSKKNMALIKEIDALFDVPAFGNFTPNHYLDYDNNVMYILSPLRQTIYLYDTDLNFKDSLYFNKANWKKTPGEIVQSINNSREVIDALAMVENQIYRKCLSFSTRIYADGEYLFVLNENTDTCYSFVFDIFQKQESGALSYVHKDLAVHVQIKGDEELTPDNFPLVIETSGRIDYWIQDGKIYLLRRDSKTSPLGLTYDKWQKVRRKEIIEDNSYLKLYVYDLKL